MSEGLSRKYRPQNFKQVVGQNHVKITLQNEILTEQIAHAYLFTGPRGIGKTSLARIMAKTLNCTNRKEKSFEPCNECNSCTSIVGGKNLDLIEMDAATHTQVDKVRENIIENVRFAPHGSKYKVFIIDEVHMLSTAAFNALLKTLEEPPEYVVFILCTTEAYKLPETIISRCQRFDFKKVSAEQILGKLKKIINWEKLNIDNKVLETIAFRTGGFIRDAESLLGQIVTLANGKKKINLEDIEPILPRSDLSSIADLVQALVNNNAKNGIEVINKLISDGVDIERFNLDLIDYLRKMILVKTGLKDKDYSLMGLPEKIEQKIIEQAESIDINKLIKILEKFMYLQPAIRDAEIPQLPLEMATIELCGLSASAPTTLKDNQPNWTTADKLQDKKSEKQETEVETKKNNLTIKQFNNSTTKTQPNENPQNNTSSSSLEQINNIWPEFIKQSQQVNHSLPLILKNAYPINLNNNLLELGFEFEIHVTRMQDEACLKSAEEILGKLLNNKIKIKPVIIPADKLSEFKPAQNTTTTDSEDSSNQVDEVLQAFGGKVIN